MNKHTVKGNMKMFVGQVKKQWGKITDDDMKSWEGCLDMLAGKVEERYGVAKEEAAKQVHKWSEKIKNA
jgi:uncharacterized protein YjbJ (UPF0337 family)